ncbi:MAG: hypothetical protein PVI90_00380 [Desulfobacteraceae bacterium]
MLDSFCTTYTGKRFYFSNPQPEMVCLQDIAHALSQLCRFGGHSKHFYSVAEHSVLVSYYVPTPYAAEALLHDAAEAYCGDARTPFKRLLTVKTISAVDACPVLMTYAMFERQVLKMIFEKYSLFWPLNPIIERADSELFIAEYRTLISEDLPEYLSSMPPLKLIGRTISCYSPSVAKQKFLARAQELGIGVEK